MCTRYKSKNEENVNETFALFLPRSYFIVNLKVCWNNINKSTKVQKKYCSNFKWNQLLVVSSIGFAIRDVRETNCAAKNKFAKIDEKKKRSAKRIKIGSNRVVRSWFVTRGVITRDMLERREHSGARDNVSVYLARSHVL